MDGLAVLVVQVDAVHELAVNVELLVEGGAVADANGLAAAVAVEVREFMLGDVGLAADGEHDGETAVFHAGFEKTLADEVHVGVCFFGEAQAEEDVDCEAGVADPGEAVVPVSFVGGWLLV